jgi:thymidylate synthase (FAD)
MAEEVIFRDDVSVELIKASASDADVIWAARVKTQHVLQDSLTT